MKKIILTTFIGIIMPLYCNAGDRSLDALKMSLLTDDLEKFKKFYQHINDPNFQLLPQSSLIQEARGPRITSFLIEQEGSQLETKDLNGNTPLINAVVRLQPAIVELLVEKGANIDTKNKAGHTAYTLAALLTKMLKEEAEKIEKTKGTDSLKYALTHQTLEDAQKILRYLAVKKGKNVPAVSESSKKVSEGEPMMTSHASTPSSFSRSKTKVNQKKNAQKLA